MDNGILGLYWVPLIFGNYHIIAALLRTVSGRGNGPSNDVDSDCSSRPARLSCWPSPGFFV